jgi:hypothetical protein
MPQTTTILECEHCGEHIHSEEAKAELATPTGLPDHRGRTVIIVHAEPCAVELLNRGWIIA